MINPDNRDVETRLPRGIIARLNAGEDVVVVREANRIEAATRMPGSRSASLYASRDFNVPGFQQSIRAGNVLADYNALFDRSQKLPLPFNGTLYLVSLLLLALAVVESTRLPHPIVPTSGHPTHAPPPHAGG